MMRRQQFYRSQNIRTKNKTKTLKTYYFLFVSHAGQRIFVVQATHCSRTMVYMTVVVYIIGDFPDRDIHTR